MKDIDEMICNEMYECCKDNMEFIPRELIYNMGGYKTSDEFLDDVRSSPDTALWALCHILDGAGDENFVEDMEYAWVVDEYINLEGWCDDIVYYVSDGDEKRYFKIGVDNELTYTYYAYEVKKVTKTITVWE